MTAMHKSDQSASIRMSLKQGDEPLDWYGGFFLPEDEESLYPPTFDVQSFILDRTKWDRREALLKQAKIDALILRQEDIEKGKKSA